MTPLALFETLGPILGPLIEEQFHRKDLCVLGTRAALDVAHYFGVAAWEIPVRVLLGNAAYFEKIEHGVTEEEDRAEWWKSGPYHSVGVGFGAPTREGFWDGHLIAAAPGVMGDFMIRQAERVERGIVTGPAVISPREDAALRWTVANDEGTVIRYERIEDHSYRRAPDWRLKDRRHRIVGAAIRAVKRG